MGWIAHRQGLLYAQEYNWNEHYEALVAKIVGAIRRKFRSAQRTLLDRRT